MRLNFSWGLIFFFFFLGFIIDTYTIKNSKHAGISLSYSTGLKVYLTVGVHVGPPRGSEKKKKKDSKHVFGFGFVWVKYYQQKLYIAFCSVYIKKKYFTHFFKGISDNQAD